MDSSQSSTDDLHPAFLTTESSEGTRIPISGERIVIVLGEDDAGRPLELSIVLKKSPRQPRKVRMYAVNEPAHEGIRRGWFPAPIIEPCNCVNVFDISVDYEAWNVERGDPSSGIAPIDLAQLLEYWPRLPHTVQKSILHLAAVRSGNKCAPKIAESQADTTAQ